MGSGKIHHPQLLMEHVSPVSAKEVTLVMKIDDSPASVADKLR
jgi:hypothetical protein